MRKTIKRKQAKKVIKSNPDWSWKSLFMGKDNKGHDVSIPTEDGKIILTGKRQLLPEFFQRLSSFLEKNKKDIKFEFQPDGSTKKYILNTPFDPTEERSRKRDMLGRGDYFSYPRGED